MKLSVVIVNYNVKYFLEQCLHSVCKAAAAQPTEIIVVDNRSTDGSLDYLRPRFPAVRFVDSETNAGFGTACNRGLREATGEYILFLNPDTLVAEDSFAASISFFEARPRCGALGVKMLDGSGAFLKESKRAFPSPLTSLFKLAGLSSLFPQSKVFSRYHLGHLPKEQDHEVDVLAGAYLLTTRAVLQNVGAFDEAFFMYGEDVDLSYRIQKAGYQNWYCAQTAIIHFKGESTKRGSLNYVRMFYQAMNVFVQKHYGGAKAGLFRLCIRVAIWLRAAVAAFFKLLRWTGTAAVDAALILFSFWAVKEAWTALVRTDVVYPDKLLLVSFPLFTLLYLVAAYYAGLYDRHYKRGRVLRATAVATVVLLAVYALLPERYRFSRAVVVFGAALAFVLVSAARWALRTAGVLQPPEASEPRPHLLVAGTETEYAAVQAFLRKRGLENRLIGRVGLNGTDGDVATLSAFGHTAGALKSGELVFCAGALSYKQIIAHTERLRGRVKFRYHAAGSGSIVGSDTSTDSGEALSAEADFALARAGNRRLKRLLDFSAALLFLLSFPLHLFLVKRPLRFFTACLAVLAGQKTWVGYATTPPSVPPLRTGVLGPTGPTQPAPPNAAQLDYWYARHYEPSHDAKTLLAHYRRLGD